jgi:hypothetical protein
MRDVSGRALHAAALAAIAAAAIALGGCGGDGAGASGGDGATQTAPGAGSSGASASSIAMVVSAAVPVTGNGAVSGSTVTDAAAVGTTRAVVADGLGAGGLAHRIRVDYDSVSGVVLAVTHGWGASAGVFEASAGCVRVVTAINPTVCTGATLDLAGGRIVFTNTLLRGSGVFTSLLNGSIAFRAP